MLSYGLSNKKIGFDMIIEYMIWKLVILVILAFIAGLMGWLD